MLFPFFVPKGEHALRLVREPIYLLPLEIAPRALGSP